MEEKGGEFVVQNKVLEGIEASENMQWLRETKKRGKAME